MNIPEKACIFDCLPGLLWLFPFLSSTRCCGCSFLSSGMRRSPDVSPRRLSDISPQLRQLKYLVVDEAIKEDLKWRSVEDLTSASVGLTSIEERILRITGYYGYQPWATSYKTASTLPSVSLSLSLPPSPPFSPNFQWAVS
ncbi:Solute carrier family 35 member F4, partial [Ophiophagus hannah]